MIKNKLEARIARLEKKVKNEGFDLSADVHNWMVKYCRDFIKSGGSPEELMDDLDFGDKSKLADQCVDDFIEAGILDIDAAEDYYDQIEYDIENEVDDLYSVINHGYDVDDPTARLLDWSGDKNFASWMDKFRDNDAYTASLESRINKLENSLKNEDLDTANDMQMEYARNVSFLADKMMRAAEDIEEQAEASGDEKLHSAVYKTMRALGFVQFYLERKLR